MTISVASSDLDGGAANADAGTDYEALVATVLTFTGGGATAHTVSVSTIDDMEAEGDEDYRVTIAGQSAGTIATSQANTIIEDDNDETFLVWSVAGTTGLTEGGLALYTVSYTGASLAPGQTMTISVASSDLDGGAANADAGTDYEALVATVLTFTGGGATAHTVSVSTIDDMEAEGDEDYRVTIAGQSAGTIATSQANTIIEDDDAPSLTWHIHGGGPAQGPAPIVSSGGGGGDDVGNGGASTPGGGGTDSDGDGGSTEIIWSINGTNTVQEGGGPALYTVSYTGAPLTAGQTALVTVGTGAGTNPFLPDATTGIDFGTLSTVLTFTSGTGISRTVSVSIVNDAIAEADEDYSVTIGGATIGQLGITQAETVIEVDAADGRPAPIWSVAGSSAIEEGDAAIYTVGYTGMPLADGETATITIATAAGGFTGTLTDATAGLDYAAVSTVLTFTRGTGTSQTIQVSTVGDGAIEGDEDFRVTIAGQSVGTLNTTQANTIIQENSATTLEWSIVGQGNVSEGATAVYTVSYDGPTINPGQTALVTVSTGAGTIATLPNATAGIDYTSVSTVLTFTSDSKSGQTIGVSIVNDAIAEAGEDFVVQVTGVSIGTIVTSQVDTVISIDPSDGDPGLFWNLVGSSVVNEGGVAEYSVSYTGSRIEEGETETVTVATAGGFTGTLVDATAGVDYGSIMTVLTFTAGGSTIQTIQVSTVDDGSPEGDEDYTVQITGTSSGQLNLSQANTVIEDAATGPFLEWIITGVPVAGEINGTALYSVGYVGDTLAPGQTALITVGTGPGFTGTLTDATAGVDYVPVSTVLTFTGGGVTAQTLAVSIIYDDLDEGQEDYTVTIADPTVGTVVVGQANTVIDICDNTSTVSENGGPAIYTVWYTGATLAPGFTATITVATGPGFTGSLPDAGEGVDYTSMTTILTFTGGGPTAQTIAVSMIDDTLLEGDEDYTVTITGQSDGSIGTSQANTVIADDDQTNVTWHVTGSSLVAEGDTAQYTVSYTGGALAPGATAFITVMTGDADIDPNNATADADYTSASTILTFTGGGVTAQTLSVSTIHDTLVEGDEDYQVSIDPSLGAIGAGSQHTIIADDDGASLNWAISPIGLDIAEGATGIATVSYTGATIAPGFTATITVGTGAGWSGGLPDAIDGDDYTGVATVLTFTGGTGTFQTIAISTIEDSMVEGNEDFTVTIENASVGTIATSQALGTIVDDDAAALTWNIAGSSQLEEGNTANYTVNYTGATLAPGMTATITVATANLPGSPPNATPGIDYTALNTILTFTGGGVTQRTVAVSTIEDADIEGTEDYAVVISNQSIGVVGTGQANTNIIDDDRAWSIGPGTIAGVEGTTHIYTVSYTGVALTAGQTATISVGTAGGFTGTLPNATAGADYTAVSTILTFTAGTGTQRTVAVSTFDDALVENTEDYRITIAAQSTGTMATTQANGIITDNDSPSLQWNVTGTPSLNEGQTATYSVNYTGAALAPGVTATITIATGDADGNTIANATAGADYGPQSIVLTFTGGGATQKTVAVSTINDTLNEPDEDFGVTLSGQSLGTINTGSVTTVINFSDPSTVFKVNEVSVGATVTAPGGISTNHWIELWNAGGTTQLTAGLSLQILGATGGIKTIALPELTIPSGSYVVVYDQGADARYGVFNSAGVLQSSGLIAGGGGWNFGSDTSQRVGVNILAGSTSADLFIANGATAGMFTGAGTWVSPGLSGGGYAAAAGLFAGSFALLTNQTAYNGQVDNQDTILQKLGLRAGPAIAANNDVFLRVDTTENNNGTDWTTATFNGDSAGAANNASYINPNDPSETITHNQASAPAGEGQDILHAAAGGATLNGQVGNDFLYGNAGNDTLFGGGGDDFLFGHSGNDRLFGGPGGDVLVDVAGTIAANAGDYMEGGTGHDILLGTYGGSANNVAMLIVGDVTLLNSSNGNDWIHGGGGSDTIIGDNVNFDAIGQGTFLSNPFAVGRPASAFAARAGTGSDTIFGGGGGDLIGSSGGQDSVFGDDPNNLAISGNDTIATDAGNDFADGGPGNDSIDLGGGTDTGRGGNGNDTIDGGGGTDFIYGENHDDYLIGGAGGDQIYGDDPANTTTGSDTILAGLDNDFVVGGALSDLIYGEGGNDFIDGDISTALATGDDTLHGGTGDDTLIGGPGIDLYGLDGATSGVNFDFLNAIAGPPGWQIMNLTANGLGVDWFREMEGVAGSAFNDTITDGLGGGYYMGGAGSDLYIDGEGQDTYEMSHALGDHDTLVFGAITATAVPNTIVNFGSSYDPNPANSSQDYIDLDAIFDAFGVATADRAASVQIFDPPGLAPISLLIDADGPGGGGFLTAVVFQGIVNPLAITFGNSASDDIQLGTL
jgi:Ca2+-binding RTX toxin-like protein